jgi:BlaI family transcriptional regulator, penicillinase repressor
MRWPRTAGASTEARPLVQPAIRRPEGSPRLTAPQLALLKVLWERSEATVAEMQRALHAERPMAASTIATLLSRLEKRGIVAYRIEGRQYVYRAVLNERDAREHALVEVTQGLFEGDIATMVSQLLSSHELRPGDLARVKALVEAKEQELEKRRRS